MIKCTCGEGSEAQYHLTHCEKQGYIYGLPIYEDADMPEGMAALVDSQGNWIGIVEKKLMTKEEFRNYARSLKK